VGAPYTAVCARCDRRLKLRHADPPVLRRRLVAFVPVLGEAT
jgi:hypothetical protein